MSLFSIFKKQGGLNLIKQYIKGGAFFTAISEFIILGKSSKALEILRLSSEYKIKRRLEKKYSKKLECFDKQWDNTVEHKNGKYIWVCWFQGMESAPDVVKRCFDSLNKNIIDREIRLITSDNMYDYIEFPDFIQEKIDKGIIKGAHLSDLMRLELLLKYGGTWIDATVFVSDNKVPAFMLDSDLFLFQNLKPGLDGHATRISNWFITASTNNKILASTRYLLHEYWRKNNDLVNYFIFHIFFEIVIERNMEAWNKVVPYSNATEHILLLRLFDEYDEVVWNGIKGQTPIHKLSYKNKEDDISKENTYYKKILFNN